MAAGRGNHYVYISSGGLDASITNTAGNSVGIPNGHLRSVALSILRCAWYVPSWFRSGASFCRLRSASCGGSTGLWCCLNSGGGLSSRSHHVYALWLAWHYPPRPRTSSARISPCLVSFTVAGAGRAVSSPVLNMRHYQVRETWHQLAGDFHNFGQIWWPVRCRCRTGVCVCPSL